MSKVDISTAKTVSQNVRKLLDHYKLTEYGLAAGAGLEIHTIRKILKERTNISTISAKKIAHFFGLTLEDIFSSRTPRLQRAENIQELKNFIRDNNLNTKYFVGNKSDSIVARFLREILIKDSFLNEHHRVSEIAQHVKVQYSRSFEPKTIAKELARMYDEGLIDRFDKTGKAKVYWYFVRRTKQE